MTQINAQSRAAVIMTKSGSTDADDGGSATEELTGGCGVEKELVLSRNLGGSVIIYDKEKLSM